MKITSKPSNRAYRENHDKIFQSKEKTDKKEIKLIETKPIEKQEPRKINEDIEKILRDLSDNHITPEKKMMFKQKSNAFVKLWKRLFS